MYFLFQMQLNTSMSLRGTLQAKKQMITQGNTVVHIPNPLHSPQLPREVVTVKGNETKKNSRENKNKAEGSERVKSDAHSVNLLKPTKACILFKYSPKKTFRGMRGISRVYTPIPYSFSAVTFKILLFNR